MIRIIRTVASQRTFRTRRTESSWAAARLACTLTLASALCFGQTSRAQTTDFNLFPLAEGNQWALANSLTKLPAYITVMSSKVFGGKRSVRLRVDAPFSSTTLLLSVNANQVILEGVASDGGRSYLDEELILFTEAGGSGDWWSNTSGKVSVLEDNIRVNTSAGSFEHCRHFRLELALGVVQDWYLAPGVGVVRFGGDVHPFVLDIANVKAYEGRQAVTPTSGVCPRVGIDANPAAPDGFSDQAKENRLIEAIIAGHSFQNVSFTWAELEPRPGRYELDEVRKAIAIAQRFGLETTFTLKTVDTRVLSIPQDLKGKPLDSPEVIERFRTLIHNLIPILGPSVKWLQLANEVDTYFLYSPEVLPQFFGFFSTGKELVKKKRNDLSVSVVFAHNDYRLSDAVYQLLSPLCDHIAFTYYPLRSSLVARDVTVARPEIAEMVDAANGKPVLFTEIGYPSSEKLSYGSLAQRDFYRNVFTALQEHPDRIIGASFFLMSDIPQLEVIERANYYGVKDDGSFASFLGSLGLFDLNGEAKPAWDLFSSEASALRGRNVCLAEN